MLKKHNGLIIILAVLLAWTVVFPIWRDHIFQAPLSVPISISPPGSVQADFHVPADEYYDLIFIFDRNGIASEELRRIVGSGHNIPGDKGVAIALHWEIHSLSRLQLVSEGRIESLNAYRWPPGKVIRRIGTFVLEPGDYRLTAMILRNEPAFAFIPAQIGLEMNGAKGAYRSPLVRQIYWLGFLEPVVWFFDVLLAIILALKLWGDLRQCHSQK